MSAMLMSPQLEDGSSAVKNKFLLILLLPKFSVENPITNLNQYTKVIFRDLSERNEMKFINNFFNVIIQFIFQCCVLYTYLCMS